MANTSLRLPPPTSSSIAHHHTSSVSAIAHYHHNTAHHHYPRHPRLHILLFLLLLSLSLALLHLNDLLSHSLPPLPFSHLSALLSHSHHALFSISSRHIEHRHYLAFLLSPFAIFILANLIIFSLMLIRSFCKTPLPASFSDEDPYPNGYNYSVYATPMRLPTHEDIFLPHLLSISDSPQDYHVLSVGNSTIRSEPPFSKEPTYMKTMQKFDRTTNSWRPAEVGNYASYGAMKGGGSGSENMVVTAAAFEKVYELDWPSVMNPNQVGKLAPAVVPSSPVNPMSSGNGGYGVKGAHLQERNKGHDGAKNGQPSSPRVQVARTGKQSTQLTDSVAMVKLEEKEKSVVSLPAAPPAMVSEEKDKSMVRLAGSLQDGMRLEGKIRNSPADMSKRSNMCTVDQQTGSHETGCNSKDHMMVHRVDPPSYGQVATELPPVVANPRPSQNMSKVESAPMRPATLTKLKKSTTADAHGKTEVSMPSSTSGQKQKQTAMANHDKLLQRRMTHQNTGMVRSYSAHRLSQHVSTASTNGDPLVHMQRARSLRSSNANPTRTELTIASSPTVFPHDHLLRYPSFSESLEGLSNEEANKRFSDFIAHRFALMKEELGHLH